MSHRKMNKIRSDNLNGYKAEQEVILNSDIMGENLPAPGFEPMTYFHCSRAFLTGFRPPRAYPTRLGPSNSHYYGGLPMASIATFSAASKHPKSLYIRGRAQLFADNSTLPRPLELDTYQSFSIRGCDETNVIPCAAQKSPTLPI